MAPNSSQPWRTRAAELPDWLDARTSLPAPRDTPIQAKILDAARRCYLRYGAQKFSMVDVAKVAGVSRGSIYSYYSERKRLLADVSEWAIGSFMEDLSKAMDSATTYPDKIGAAAVIMHRWTSVFHDPRFDDILHTPYEAVALIRESGPVLLRIMATLRPHVVAAARQGEIRADIDVERASEWVARLLQSLATSPAQTFDPGDPEALERLFSRFVLKGLA